MYHTYQDFQDTSFYKKYNSRIKTIAPPKKFARYMSGSIPGQERNSLGMGDSGTYLHNTFEKYGQKWRVMFFQGDMSGELTSGNDYYVYYIDCTDLNDYLDMLEEFYNNRDTLQPQEVIIMLSSQYQALLKAREAQTKAQGYTMGYTKGDADGQVTGYKKGDADGQVTGAANQKAQDDAAQKAKDDAAKQASEDNSSSIWGDIGSAALEVLPFLL